MIRLMEPGDIPDVVDVLAASYAESSHDAIFDPAAAAASLANWLATPWAALLVGEIDGRIAGVAGFVLTPSPWNRQDVQAVETCWSVHPAGLAGKTGKTLFVRLLDASLTVARGMGATTFVTGSAAGGDSVLKLLARRGIVHRENLCTGRM